LDKLASFSFNEIELECECDPDPQPCASVPIFESMLTLVSLPNFDQFSEPIFIPMPIDLEIESPFLDNHISLMEKECKFHFFDLDSILKPKPTLEPKLDLSLIPRSVLVPIPFISEPKSSNSSYLIPLLDIGINYNDSVIIFQDWSYEGNNFHNRILHDPIHIGDCKYVNRKEVNKDEFREPPHYLNWVAMLGSIRPLEPPP